MPMGSQSPHWMRTLRELLSMDQCPVSQRVSVCSPDEAPRTRRKIRDSRTRIASLDPGYEENFLTEAPRLACTSCGSARSIGVEKIPGAIASTRMPDWANSRAAGIVKATMPPLEAE